MGRPMKANRAICPFLYKAGALCIAGFTDEQLSAAVDACRAYEQSRQPSLRLEWQYRPIRID
jgi:hypothetical protein